MVHTSCQAHSCLHNCRLSKWPEINQKSGSKTNNKTVPSGMFHLRDVKNHTGIPQVPIITGVFFSWNNEVPYTGVPLLCHFFTFRDFIKIVTYFLARAPRTSNYTNVVKKKEKKDSTAYNPKVYFVAKLSHWFRWQQLKNVGVTWLPIVYKTL
jgi:hypothetical protein